VPVREFLFALEMSDEPHFDAMLRELAGAVLVHIGYEPRTVDELRGLLRTALVAGHAGSRRGPCDISFRVRSGQLHITVACAGAAEWRTTRPLP